MGDVIQIYDDYKNHADFLTVYVREAHPTDEWQMKSNVKDDVCYAQPKTLEQRAAIADRYEPRLDIRGSGRWCRRKRDAQLSQAVMRSGQPSEHTGLSGASAQVGHDSGEDHGQCSEAEADVGQRGRAKDLAQQGCVSRMRRASSTRHR